MLVFSRRAALAAAVALAGLTGAYADEVKYSAKLDGAAETPPNDSKASGTIDATFDTATKTLTWTADYSGLSGPATGAHFHGPAPAGKAAGVLVPVAGELASPIKGSAKLTDAQAKDLSDGMVYFNIHTAAHQGGEIRGQMMKAM
ncbi:MAG: CHRD domain-containing protein [Pseudomonadota bacterium]|nr:CHRD domain-containing protein [Pseudomonadota bacterium]